jgi:hypothetical protein
LGLPVLLHTVPAGLSREDQAHFGSQDAPAAVAGEDPSPGLDEDEVVTCREEAAGFSGCRRIGGADQQVAALQVV